VAVLHVGRNDTAGFYYWRRKGGSHSAFHQPEELRSSRDR
jgi:hypothetical protein